MSGIYTAPSTPNCETTPLQAWQNYLSQPHKFWYVEEVYKMEKVLEDLRENG